MYVSYTQRNYHDTRLARLCLAFQLGDLLQPKMQSNNVLQAKIKIKRYQNVADRNRKHDITGRSRRGGEPYHGEPNKEID